MMSFKSFIWPHNPKHIEISMCKNAKTHYLPGLGPYIQILGNDYRTVTGCGEFFGPSAIESFEKLSLIFKKSAPGKLFVPPITSMHATFTELSMIGKAGPDLISYKFKFIEHIFHTKKSSINYDNISSYVLGHNETPWDISLKFGIPIENILKKNPYISDPFTANPGQRIIVQ